MNFNWRGARYKLRNGFMTIAFAGAVVGKLYRMMLIGLKFVVHVSCAFTRAYRLV
jgi:hypothetical protein